jgi:Hydroxymethylglutaryl-coenzyme A synthase N terminal
LGQHNLSIPCGDVEDINSICLTVVTNLLQK